MPGIRTAAQAKAWLEQQGKSVQEFAREHSVDPATTYQILAGRKKGRRGESHKVAVLLGMKIGSIPENKTPLSEQSLEAGIGSTRAVTT